MIIALLPEDFKNAITYSNNKNCPLACALRRLGIEFSYVSSFGNIILNHEPIMQFNWKSKPDSIQHLNPDLGKRFDVDDLIDMCKEGFTFEPIVLESL